MSKQHGQLPNNETSPPDRKRVRRSPVSMDQVPPVGYPHQPQQMMNGGMLRPGLGPMPGGPMNNFQQHGPPGIANPGMGIPMGPQGPGNTMSPGMGGPRAPNMIGVSSSRVFSSLRIEIHTLFSITKAFTRPQRALLWRICQEGR